MYIKWVKGCPYVYRGQDEYLGSYFKYRFNPRNQGKSYTDDIITTLAAKRKAATNWSPKMRAKIVEIDKLARLAEAKTGAARRKRRKK